MQVPAHFEYERATSVAQALTLLTRYAPGARVLAGGHSLIPMMKLRLAQPEVLVDINGIHGLRYIERAGAILRIGALARHADLLSAQLAGDHFAILHDAERVIADPVVRNWGTIGASGGTVNFGFTGSDSGQTPAPAAFHLNGAICSNN